jgi:glutamate/tyrosine decarboxylase-like PLP-dependent enzyme
MDRDPLALDAETMRRLGYRTVDMLVDRLTDASIPALRRATPAEMRERLSEPQPRGPHDLDEILEQLQRDVLPFMGRSDHPGYFAFVPFGSTWPSALGDFVASALNVYAGSWMESAGPSQVELEVLGWFKQWLGYPEASAGSLVSGGSAANLTALACARAAAGGATSADRVVYVSDQSHSSLARAARLLGYGSGQVRVVPVDDELRLQPATLAAAMDADVRAGRRPFFVSASAGATNTGSVDPFAGLADLCAERGVWLHADAAYGGFAVLTERGRTALAGIERAESITLDPHKWLYQPYECGCILVRDGARLREAFEIVPDYLRDSEAHDAEVNFSDLGLQLSRSTRAFKLWFSLRYFGIDAFAEAIDRTLDLAAHAVDVIEASPVLELRAPPSLGIVCFRRRFDDTDDELEIEQRNASLAAAVEASGVGLVSSTRLHGRYALRLCVLNHTTRREHVDTVLELISTAGFEHRPRLPPLRERHPGVADGRLANVPLFAGLSRDQLAEVEGRARAGRFAAGASIVERWDATRDFYVVEEGVVRVVLDGEVVRRLGPGDFFGELAALDWGAGYGYPRLATVVAESDVRLLVFSEGTLAELVRTLPSVETRIRAAVQERLAAR